MTYFFCKQNNTRLIATYVKNQLKSLQCESLQQVDHIGNVYLGKVLRVLPQINTAFIDIGLEKHAFFEISELKQAPVSTQVKMTADQKPSIFAGQMLLVQIKRPSIKDKGAKVSCEISLEAPSLVLSTRKKKTCSVSKKITSQEVRKNLKKSFEPILQEDFGWVVRTGAAHRPTEALLQEADSLLLQWQQIQAQMRTLKQPCCLLQHSKLQQWLMSTAFQNEDAFIYADQSCADDVQAYAKTLNMNYKNVFNAPVQDHAIAQIFAKDLQALLQPSLQLASGASILIEHTETMTVIDVNSDQYQGYHDQQTSRYIINAEAAIEIARQIKLRTIGGLIVIDFLKMDSKNDQNKIRDLLQQQFSDEKNQALVGRFSQFGLLELAIKTASPPLHMLFKQHSFDTFDARKIY